MLDLRVAHIPKGYDPGEAMELLERILEACEFGGTWTCRPGTQVRCKSESRFKVVRQTGMAVRVRVKPGDNGTCWEWDLIPPSVHKPESVYVALKQLDGWNGRGDPRKLTAPPDVQVPAEVKRPAPAVKIEPAKSAMAPAKPAANGKPATCDVQATIDRIMQLRDRAVQFEQRAERVRSRQENIERLYGQVSELEESLAAERAEHEADAAGRDAVAALAALGSVLGA